MRPLLVIEIRIYQVRSTNKICHIGRYRPASTAMYRSKPLQLVGKFSSFAIVRKRSRDHVDKHHIVTVVALLLEPALLQ